MKKKRFIYWRTVVPAIFFVMVTVLAARLNYPLPGDAGLLLWLSRLDPLLLVAQLRQGGEVLSWFLLPLAVVIVTLLMGRLFCGWLCPIGGLLAVLHSARAPFCKRPAFLKVPAFAQAARYYWLAFLMMMLLLGTNWPLLLTPYTLLSHEIARVWLKKIPWLLLGVPVAGLLFFPRFWCVYLCPTGLFLSAISTLRRRHFSIEASCSQCGLCEAQCPAQAAKPPEAKIDEHCILCARCWENCPREAVSWRGNIPGGAEKPYTFLKSRRTLIKASASALAVAAVWPFLRLPAFAKAPLRPPGALPEEDFTAICNRCGRCVKVCPTEALHPAPLTAGAVVFDTPVFIPRIGRCELCLLCQEVCPTGAIRPTPLERIKIGTATLDRSACLAHNGVECLICAEQCPFQAVQLDSMRKPYVLEDRCVGCGACENGCPLEEAAIRIG